MDPSKYTTSMAGDPGMPPEVMAEIARTRPDLHEALSRNPALYPQLRGWLDLALRSTTTVEADGGSPSDSAAPDIAPQGTTDRPRRRRLVATGVATAAVVVLAGGVVALGPWRGGRSTPMVATSARPTQSVSASPGPISTTPSPVAPTTPTPSETPLTRTYAPVGFSYLSGVIRLPTGDDGTAEILVPGVGVVSAGLSHYFPENAEDETSDFRVLTSGVGGQVLVAAFVVVRTPAEGAKPEVFTGHLRVYDPSTGEMLWEASAPSSELSSRRVVGLSNGDIAVGVDRDDGNPAQVVFHDGRTGTVVGRNEGLMALHD